VQPRPIARPGLGRQYLRGRAYSRRAHKAAAQGARAILAGAFRADRARRGLSVLYTGRIGRDSTRRDDPQIMAAMWTFALARLAGIFAVGLGRRPVFPAYLALGSVRGLPLPGLAATQFVSPGSLVAAALATRSAQHRRSLGRCHRAGGAPASPQTISQTTAGAAVSRVAALDRGAAGRRHHSEQPKGNRLVQPPGRALAGPEAPGGYRSAHRQSDSRAGIRALSARRCLSDALDH